MNDVGIWMRNQFYNHLVGSLLPVSWFAPKAPRPHELESFSGKLELQIVSHCWNYAHLSVFQLSSIVNYPPTLCNLTYTLFYAKEDEEMVKLIEKFSSLSIPGVSWDWQELPRAELFRRAIGRNKAAKNSQAHWVWFSDCDLIFHENCLDSLAVALAEKQTGLVYPDHEGITDLLPADHPMLNQKLDQGGTVDVDTALFYTNRIEKAKGAFQIVHGDVARAAGYCGTIGIYQRPSSVWRKTYEDTVFRKLIEYSGEPVSVDNLFRIRHAVKGRYAKDSAVSRIRGNLRKATDRVNDVPRS